MLAPWNGFPETQRLSSEAGLVVAACDETGRWEDLEENEKLASHRTLCQTRVGMPWNQATSSCGILSLSACRACRASETPADTLRHRSAGVSNSAADLRMSFMMNVYGRNVASIS